MRSPQLGVLSCLALLGPAHGSELIQEPPAPTEQGKYATFAIPDSAAPTTAAADTVFAEWPSVMAYAVEPSYISMGSGFNHPQHLTFEANISPAFQVTRFGSYSAILSPKVILRMLDQGSKPVRTPSFMPRVTLLRVPEPGRGRTYSFWSLMLSHHSNGQEGDFFASDSSANVADGSFSCNFLRLAWHQIRNIRRQQTGALRSADYFDLALHWYPNFNRSDEIDGHYGFWRTSGRWRNYFRKRGYDFAFQVEGTLILGAIDRIADSADDPHRMIVDARLFYRPKWSQNFGFYVDYYAGQDYYNIRFAQNLNVVRFGIATDLPVLDLAR